MNHRQKRQVLEHSPLVLVLAEVRFPSILKMDSRIPDVQDQLRGCGFPRFTQAVGQEIIFAPGEGPKLTTSARWLFGSRSDDEHVILTNTSVALQTTKYQNFERFTETLERVINVLLSTVPMSFTERLGLRFYNVIHDGGTGELDQYINPQMCALNTENLEANDVLWTVETLANTDAGQLRVRLTQQVNSPSLPLDLLTPELSGRFPVVSDKTTGLDIDCSTQEAVDFEPKELLAALWSLHYYTATAFRASVTSKALTAWGEQSEPAE